MGSRREFLGRAAAAAMAAAILPARGAGRPMRLAWFSGGTLEDHRKYLEAFRGGMKQLGYVEGRDYALAYYWRGETIKPFGWMARDIVSDRPDVILATCEVTAEAAAAATRSIPIILTAATMMSVRRSRRAAEISNVDPARTPDR